MSYFNDNRAHENNAMNFTQIYYKQHQRSNTVFTTFSKSSASATVLAGDIFLVSSIYPVFSRNIDIVKEARAVVFV